MVLAAIYSSWNHLICGISKHRLVIHYTLYFTTYQKEKFRNKFPWKARVFDMLWKQGYTDRELNKIELHMKFPTLLNVWGIFMGLMAFVMVMITSIFKSYDQTDCIFWINCASIIHLAIYMLCFGFTCFNLNPKNSFIERWIYYEIRKYEEKEKNNDNTI